MILVLAARLDRGARQLVKSLGTDRARLLTVDDLSSPGWRVDSVDPAASQAVVQGEPVPAAELTGVVTRLPAVTGAEIRRIRPEDRDYAASEMTAFLNYWLSTLPCPVLNPPVPSSLCGPGWRAEQWAVTARELGLAVRPHRREIGPFRPGGAAGDGGSPGPLTHSPALQATVVGGRRIDGGPHGLSEFTQALAAAAEVPMLTAFFEEYRSSVRFVDAQPWVSAHDPAVVDAIRGHFAKAGARAGVAR